MIEIVPITVISDRTVMRERGRTLKQSAAVPADPNYRYEELASFITGLVDGGTLSPGARAPSLRQISRQRRISLSTAMQAYRLLEDRGVLEARPQSGFYIAKGSAISLQTPAISRHPPNPP